MLDAIIKPLHENIVICPECEAFWTGNTPIRMETFRDFTTYMETRGLPGYWQLLQITGKHEPIDE